MPYHKGFKQYMFRKDAETAHHQTIALLKKGGTWPLGKTILSALYGANHHAELEQTLWGIRFPNPVGLAAGMDKDGEAVPGFSRVGFGFLEIGTLTPKPQPGNPKPRVFRLLEDEALINRMGFNNHGAERAAKTLSRLNRGPIPLGINIGKNKQTANEQAVEDYKTCIRTLYPYGDYFVVNISSPNTPGLRKLQYGEELKRLITSILDECREQENHGQSPKPVLVKLSPDVSLNELENILKIIREAGTAGIIATNTTLERPGLKSVHQEETGGLSGKPLTAPSTQMIRRIFQMTEGTIPIIGVGGIFDGQDAYEKICAGASLVQVYTGLIYKGPRLLKQINDDLKSRLMEDGFSSLADAVGSSAR